ncbi:MAG: hypothetical protein HW398_19 [Acidobacteria bacterium]|nr:hypothetical protein [Acidobacteriota bacterium]
MIASALLLFPLIGSAEYIKAVNYFGKSWPIAFWNSDLSQVSADFQTIRRDGFNSIILIVPWGEFQPGLDPIRFNDDAYRRLSWVCNQAREARLRVFLRVSYNADYYPGVEQPFAERANSLLAHATLLPAWEQYLARINAATRPCAHGAFISWEDFWFVILIAERLKTPEERAAHSKQFGYASWIARNADDAYKARYAADLRRFGVYPIPRRDSPDFQMYFRYFDDQLMNKLVPALAKHFRQASVEARTDSDPIYGGGKDVLQWYEHANHYRVTSSNFLMTYWSPAIGAANQSERESAGSVIERFNYLHRNLLAQTPNEIVIGQWLFQDNTPQFHYNAQVHPAEVSRFIRDSARSLAQFSSGYALWTWRDYRASILFNGFFSLEKLGWEFSPGVTVEQLPDGAFAQLAQGQWIHQGVPRERLRFIGFTENLRLRFSARGNGRLRIEVGSASQEVDIADSSGGQTVLLSFPAPSEQDPNLRVTALSGQVRLSNLHLWNFEQASDVRSPDDRPGKHHADIVALNRRLDDPKLLVSSVSASNDTIQYLAGAESPESDGARAFSWVGPYARVKLYAPGASIGIHGDMNVDLFRAAGLFPQGCTLAASINGAQVAQTRFTRNQPIVLRVNVPPESRGAVTLELRNNCAVRPQEAGLGPDARLLSYKIRQIQAAGSVPQP